MVWVRFVSLLLPIALVRNAAALRDHSVDESHIDPKESGEESENPQAEDSDAWMDAALKDIEDYMDDDTDPWSSEALNVDEILEEMDLDEIARLDEAVDPAGDQDQEDEACMFSSESSDLLEWLGAVKTTSHKCQDFGPRFGRWGAAACPSLEEIIDDLQSGSSVATGGRSGTSPRVSKRFVVKVIDKIEHLMLHKLLQKLKGHRRDTMLAPVCRSLCVKVGRRINYVQISPSIMLHGVQRSATSGGAKDWTKLFDLKGNYNWRNRAADSAAFVLKDQNFKAMFPSGMRILQVMRPDGEGKFEKLAGEEATDLFGKTMYTDGRLLAGLRLMDYSLLLHVVTFPSANSEDLWALNADKPWALAEAKLKDGSQQMFAMSFGIIDLLMHEVENRGSLNKIFALSSKCRVSDLDPIPALPYWIRFTRMLGIQLRFKTPEGACTNCLEEESGAGYTYFPSKYAEQSDAKALHCGVV